MQPHGAQGSEARCGVLRAPPFLAPLHKWGGRSAHIACALGRRARGAQATIERQKLRGWRYRTALALVCRSPWLGAGDGLRMLPEDALRRGARRRSVVEISQLRLSLCALVLVHCPLLLEVDRGRCAGREGAAGPVARSTPTQHAVHHLLPTRAHLSIVPKLAASGGQARAPSPSSDSPPTDAWQLLPLDRLKWPHDLRVFPISVWRMMCPYLRVFRDSTRAMPSAVKLPSLSPGAPRARALGVPKRDAACSISWGRRPDVDDTTSVHATGARRAILQIHLYLSISSLRPRFLCTGAGQCFLPFSS